MVIVTKKIFDIAAVAAAESADKVKIALISAVMVKVADTARSGYCWGKDLLLMLGAHGRFWALCCVCAWQS